MLSFALGNKIAAGEWFPGEPPNAGTTPARAGAGLHTVVARQQGRNADVAVDEQTQQRIAAPGRLRFVLGPDAIDVAAPADVPLADVLAAVLAQVGDTSPDTTEFVVQRLGEGPLDQLRSSTELNLLDGESLYVRPRAEALPAPGPDEDGESTTAAGLPAWSAAWTRWALQLGATGALLVGVVVLFLGSPIALQIILSGSSAVLLLVASAVMSWSGASRRSATLLAGVATCYAASAGWLMVMATQPVASSTAQWASAAAAAAVAVCAGLAGSAHAAHIFGGALTAVMLLLIPVILVAVGAESPPYAAAIGLAITLVVGFFAPGTAFRLSGLSLPMLPTNAEELREDIEPMPHETVVLRGAVTLKHLKGLHVGIGLAQCVLLIVLGGDNGTFALWFTVAFALLLSLRARHLSGLVQRWAVLVPAGVAAVGATMRFTAVLDVTDRLLYLWFPLFVAGVLLVLLSGSLPGRRLKPYWLRGVDLLESLTSLAMIPLLLGVLNVYVTMREMGS